MTRYTAGGVRREIELHRERLFAPWATGQPPGYTPDPRMKDLICIGFWIQEELRRLGCSDADRITQQNYYGRWSRSEEDLFELAARTLNAVLDGQVEQNRIPHRRWG